MLRVGPRGDRHVPELRPLVAPAAVLRGPHAGVDSRCPTSGTTRRTSIFAPSPTSTRSCAERGYRVLDRVVLARRAAGHVRAEPDRRARDLPVPPAMSGANVPMQPRRPPPRDSGAAAQRETWREALFNRRMLICVFTGFSSGLPLYLLINLLPAWLRTEGVDLKTIGLFALIQLPYTWKFLWSPLLDRYALPLLGPPPRLDARHAGRAARRRFRCSACCTRRRTSGRSSRCRRPSRSSRRARTSCSTRSAARSCPTPSSASATSIHVNAYRISSLVPGRAGADPRRPHAVVDRVRRHRAVHAARHRDDARRARAAARQGPRRARCAKRSSSRSTNSSRATAGAHALLVLLFIFLYKLGDSMATALATPFYLDMGFTKTDIGVIAKNAGPVGERRRRPARRPVDGEDRHQPRRCGCSASSSSCRSSASRGSPTSTSRTALLLAFVIAFEALGVGPRHGGVHRVHRARDRSALHGDAIRAVHEPRRRAAHGGQRVDRLDRRAHRLVRLLFCCVPCWRCPAWLLLLRVAPWSDDPTEGHPR